MQAQETGLIQRQATLEEVLIRLEKAQRWEEVAPTIKQFDAWLTKDGDRLRDYEFGIMRNGGFRILHVSDWAHGRRFMTEPYMTGDTKSSALYTGFHLGGSLWVIGTLDPEETTGPRCANSAHKDYPPAPDQDRRALHYYYFYGPEGVKPLTGNGCAVDGPIYARARLFAPEAP